MGERVVAEHLLNQGNSLQGAAPDDMLEQGV